jgi:hypothetical protein
MRLEEDPGQPHLTKVTPVPSSSVPLPQHHAQTVRAGSGSRYGWHSAFQEQGAERTMGAPLSRSVTIPHLPSSSVSFSEPGFQMKRWYNHTGGPVKLFDLTMVVDSEMHVFLFHCGHPRQPREPGTKGMICAADALNGARTFDAGPEVAVTILAADSGASGIADGP